MNGATLPVALKVAMCDEVNDSTAMFKPAARGTDAPDQGCRLGLDAEGCDLPSDWYLRLAGGITRRFHRATGPSPIPPAVRTA